MKLSLAANYDSSAIPELARRPVDELYGRLPSDGVSSGRPRYLASPVSERGLAEYVGLLSASGIAFNYLLNGACHGNQEWTKPWQKRLMKLLEKLQGIGVKRLTVSTPYLLELVKRRFPSFRVRVGVYAQIDTAKRARFWEGLGADCLTLESFSVNRDFKRLSEIRAAVSCELQLIANHLCLPNCPMQPYHQNGFAHASDSSSTLFLDYCLFNCARKRLEDPSLFIKAGWIRPEDLKEYEALGYSSFKLLERGIPSEELLKRAKAYGEGRFEGNLAELLLPYGFKTERRKESFWALRNFFKPFQANPLKLLPLMELAKSQGMSSALESNPIRIDSASIPQDFLSAFKSRDCSALDCDACGYCAKIAQRAVSVDPKFREESLRRFQEAGESLAGGGLWNV